MKKAFVSIFIISLVIPHITFASWWNPLSWFPKHNKQVEKTSLSSTNKVLEDKNWKETLTELSNSIPTTKTVNFYVKADDSRVRECPEATDSCKIIGYYHRNEVIKIDVPQNTVPSIDTLPEWVTLTFNDGKKGYINKSLLSEKISPEPVKVIPPKTKFETQQKIENYTQHSQSLAPEDLREYKDKLHNLTESLHKDILSNKEMINIEITFAKNVSQTIKSDQTSNSKALISMIEKVIPSRISYLIATMNLLDSIDRHVTKIEKIIDKAKYTVELDIYQKSLITDQEDIIRINEEIKASSNKFNENVSEIN